MPVADRLQLSPITNLLRNNWDWDYFRFLRETGQEHGEAACKLWMAFKTAAWALGNFDGDMMAAICKAPQ